MSGPSLSDMEFVTRGGLSLHSARVRDRRQARSGRYHRRVADEHAQPLDEQLKEIGAQLDWVRDYL